MNDLDVLTLTVKQAAARLQVSPDWLSRRANDGTVPSRKVGHRRMFTEQDLADYLDSVRRNAPSPQSSIAGTPLSRSRRRAS